MRKILLSDGNIEFAIMKTKMFSNQEYSFFVIVTSIQSGEIIDHFTASFDDVVSKFFQFLKFDSYEK